MIGLAVGIIAGSLQFWLLKRFTVLVTSSGIDTKCILLGVSQLVIPFAAIIGIAFLRRQDILWTGIGITASLIIGALTAYLINRRKKKGRDEDDA